MEWDKISKELSKKLDQTNVKHRDGAYDYKTGKKIKLSYITGWHAIAEANRIFGFHNWTRETVYCREVSRSKYENKKKQEMHKIGYESMVRVTVDGVAREGTGHGSGISQDLFDAIEGAAKEAETDAMKRAMMTFGNQFGLALYDTKQENVRKKVDIKDDLHDADSLILDMRHPMDVKAFEDEYFPLVEEYYRVAKQDHNKQWCREILDRFAERKEAIGG